MWEHIGRDKRLAPAWYWRSAGTKEGHQALDECDDINQDPVLRLWQRSEDMEHEDRRGVRSAAGLTVRCDADGRAVLDKHGWAQSWKARWLTVCVHLRHRFTHAAACDASLYADGVRRAAVGI